jgi:hypothetical protein
MRPWLYGDTTKMTWGRWRKTWGGWLAWWCCVMLVLTAIASLVGAGCLGDWNPLHMFSRGSEACH